jgi:hypothetical protein
MNASTTSNAHDLLQTAREAGMTILLEGRIGQQEYNSVSGTAEALRRFAHALSVPERHVAPRVRAARTHSVNPLVTARMRERIAAVLYGRNGSAPPRGRRARLFSLRRPV